MLNVTAATPPTGRDFEIHRLNRVEHVSTYRLAERFDISQTRVRQVVHRVDEWLASVLPAKSDVERGQETRLAQCLAADQLQSQIEKLQVFWDETRDPKYLRQQTRAILALARLGVVPGAIDALAAEAEERGVGVSPARMDADTKGTGREQPGRPEAYPTNPPAGDCSDSGEGNFLHSDVGQRDGSVKPDEDISSEEVYGLERATLEGLLLMEQRLLTLIESTSPDDTQALAGLEQTLSNIRRERAVLDVRVSPEFAGLGLQAVG